MSVKKSRGIIIFALYILLLWPIMAAYYYKIFLGNVKSALFMNYMASSYPFAKKHLSIFITYFYLILTLLMSLLSMSFGISGIFLLKVKDWARRLFIFQAFVFLFLHVLFFILEFNAIRFLIEDGERFFDQPIITKALLLSYVPLLIIIIPLFVGAYYFSRPKVKEQFR